MKTVTEPNQAVAAPSLETKNTTIARVPTSVDIQAAVGYLAGADGKLSDKDLTPSAINSAMKLAREAGNPGAVKVLDTIRSLYGGASKVPGGGLDNVATTAEFSAVVKPNVEFATDLNLPKPIMNRINTILKTEPDSKLYFENKIVPEDPTYIGLRGDRMAEFDGTTGGWVAPKR